MFLIVVLGQKVPKRTVSKSWTYLAQLSVPLFQFCTPLMSIPCIISHHSLCHILIFFTLHLAHQSYNHFPVFVYSICLLYPTPNVSISVKGNFWLFLIYMSMPDAQILFLRCNLSFLMQTHLVWKFHTQLKKPRL